MADGCTEMQRRVGLTQPPEAMTLLPGGALTLEMKIPDPCPALPLSASVSGGLSLCVSGPQFTHGSVGGEARRQRLEERVPKGSS